MGTTLTWCRSKCTAQHMHIASTPDLLLLCCCWPVVLLAPPPPVQVPAVLRLLLERLRNEITRLPAVKAWATLAASPLELGLDTHLEPTMVREGGGRRGGVVWSALPGVGWGGGGLNKWARVLWGDSMGHMGVLLYGHVNLGNMSCVAVLGGQVYVFQAWMTSHHHPDPVQHPCLCQGQRLVHTAPTRQPPFSHPSSPVRGHPPTHPPTHPLSCPPFFPSPLPPG